MRYDFETPNPRALSQIDSFLQNHDTLSDRWDRRISRFYSGSNGWEGVKDERPDLFYQAWGVALEFIQGIDLEIIDKY
jgi:hypothetical protein